MKNRIILHLDMDAFFASIEERENPQFKGKPIVVGADPKGGKGRGVVSTCNYQARKYGIRSAMPISEAWRRCPKAIFLPVNIELYENTSRRIMEIIKKYSKTWEIVSLDDVYLDLSFLIPKPKRKKTIVIKKPWQSYYNNINLGYKKAENLAKKLKKKIFEKEKLTSTIGIGPNKLIAKMAAEKAKPNGLLIIKPNQVKSFLEPLDIDDLPGIGPKTAEKLRAIGINKIKELKKLSKSKLKEMFGKIGETIYQKARGIDEKPVTSEEIIKSIGKEHTFEKDTRDPEIIFGTFEKLIEEVYRGLPPVRFKTVMVVCRFSGFKTQTKSKTLKEPTQNFEILKSEAKKLLLKFLLENPKLIRLIGLRVLII